MFDSISSWLQPIVTLIVGLTGAFIASKAISTNRDIARKKATIDFFSKYDIDEYSHFYGKNLDFDRILFGDRKYEFLNDKEKDFLQKDFYKYELMAVGIDQNIFDEKMCFSYVGSYLCAYTKFREPIIHEARKLAKTPLIFEHAEKLMDKWAPKISKVKKD